MCGGSLQSSCLVRYANVHRPPQFAGQSFDRVRGAAQQGTRRSERLMSQQCFQSMAVPLKTPSRQQVQALTQG